MARASQSRWWYGVVDPPALELTGAGLSWAVRITFMLSVALAYGYRRRVTDLP